MPPSCFNNGVKGAEATKSTKLNGRRHISHKLTTKVITHKRSHATTEPFPHNTSKRCRVCEPSLPHDVLF